jgi:hypothetical protein
MKIIITENQNYVLRRIQQFIDIVESHIETFEEHGGGWWCRNHNPDSFLQAVMDEVIEDFISKNWDFFHDNSEKGGANMDIRLLNNIVEENYGNYIRNLFVRKCS